MKQQGIIYFLIYLLT